MTEVCPQIGLAAANVAFKPKRQWTYFTFFSALAIFHAAVAAVALHERQPEGNMSLVFAVLFLLLAVGSLFVGCELAIVHTQRVIRLRTGFPKLYFERRIHFEDIQAIRLTTAHNGALIELLCEERQISCPPAKYPRQQALMMAIALDVKLIRVSA